MLRTEPMPAAWVSAIRFLSLTRLRGFSLVFYPHPDALYLCAMFVSFYSSDLASRPVCLTSAIGCVDISTDAPSIRISLSADGEEFYSARLYAYGGMVSVDDLASVIELHFQRKGWCRHTVTVSASVSASPEVSDSMTLDCLYCSYDVPEDFDPSRSFYTLFQVQRVPPSAVFPVYGPMTQDSVVSLRVSGRDAGFNPASYELQMYAADGYVRISIPEIAERCRTLGGLERIYTVSVFSGDLVKSVFICDMPDFLEFNFRNCFNCPETVFIPGTSVMKTEVSRDLAYASGHVLQYNYMTTRTYEHTTAPLTRIEAAVISQLVESRSVSVMADGKLYPVVITDHTSEVSSDDSTLNTLKFTWRFTGRRPRLFGDTLSPLLESYGIFTQQFTDPYQ